MYRKILVALDGSEPSAHALRHAAELAKTVGAEKVTIMHVHKDFPMQEPLYQIDLDSLLDEEDQAVMSPAVQFLSEAGIPYETHIFHGDPAHEIITYAKDHHYDVIVMGSTGKGIIKEALLGSVSHQVAHSAHCPVMILK
ncbi:universal stress protein [Heyndrickxia sporothermodurans]